MNIMSISARDAHRHNPERFSDQCKGFFIIAQEGMFNGIPNMELEDIEKWAKVIQTVALEAPFDTDVYINLCSDMDSSKPIGYDDLMEAYEGSFKSFVDFAKYYYDYIREDIPRFFYDHIDWKSISHELERKGLFYYYKNPGFPSEVHVFSNAYLREYYK